MEHKFTVRAKDQIGRIGKTIVLEVHDVDNLEAVDHIVEWNENDTDVGYHTIGELIQKKIEMYEEKKKMPYQVSWLVGWYKGVVPMKKKKEIKSVGFTNERDASVFADNLKAMNVDMLEVPTGLRHTQAEQISVEKR